MLSEADMETMEPRKLFDIIKAGNMCEAELTYAAEWIGKAKVIPEDSRFTLLKGLLESSSPLVREGAVLGLSYLIDYPGVVGYLERCLNYENSPGVRLCIIDVLGS